MEKSIPELKKIAVELRKTILEMIYTANSGHPGGSLSLADIFTVLYYKEMNIDPGNPQKPDRDRLILSKGHACPVLYGVLAMKGYFPRDVILTLRQLGSILQGHPDMKKVPGVDMTTGSLGQGLSAAVGMAFGQREQGYNARTFCVLGDGELNEGQVWEAAMLANKYKLSNLIAIVDRNNLQLDGTTDQVMPLLSLEEKWKSFGWRVLHVDGHSVEDLISTFDQANAEKELPVCVIADTVKGKGVSFMENVCGWHGKAPSKEEYEAAMRELEEVAV